MTEEQKQLNEQVKLYSVSYGMLMYQIGEKFISIAEKAIEKQVEDSKNFKKLKKMGVKKSELEEIKKKSAYQYLYHDSLLGLENVHAAIKQLKHAVDTCTDVQCGIQDLAFTKEDRIEMSQTLLNDIDFYVELLVTIYELRNTKEDAWILATLFNLAKNKAPFAEAIREKLKRQ